MKEQRILIMGAAGRDFHNFNTYFRANKSFRVVAFTAAQIPDIDDKLYPPSLAGELYPDGIPIRPESEIRRLIKDEKIDSVVFSYSDLSHLEVMHKASEVLAAGSSFWFLGPKHTTLRSSKPVIAITASRTGCGKSQTSRFIAAFLRDRGQRVVAVRHPMPYGNIQDQAVQRFAEISDLNRHQCTIEEMEEYEPYLNAGSVIFAGVDYVKILRQAEQEADIILWDGGNNDTPFFIPDLDIVVTDPHRAGHECAYHPGEVNLRRADIVVINKIDTADFKDIISLRQNILRLNPKAEIVEAASALYVDNYEEIRGKSILAVEDGPTLTHGGMRFGAAVMAAQRYGAREIVDPRAYAVGKIAEAYQTYPDIGPLLPAMGYSKAQIDDLAQTIQKTACDLILIGTPIDLNRVITLDKPNLRVRYDLQSVGTPDLKTLIEKRFGLSS